MRPTVPRPRLLIPAVAILATVLAGCSRGADKAGAPPSATTPGQEAAPVAGGPSTLKPGLWKTVTQSPTGPEEKTHCVGEGFDPAAEAAQNATPCGKPNMTRTAEGFQLDLTCEKSHIKYDLVGKVHGDFVTSATTDLDLTLSAFGRKQALHLKAVSTYQGACKAGDGT